MVGSTPDRFPLTSDNHFSESIFTASPGSFHDYFTAESLIAYEVHSLQQQYGNIIAQWAQLLLTCNRHCMWIAISYDESNQVE